MAEFMSWRGRMGGRNAAPVVDHPGLGWWREARFGMFIHWGLYAIPAGIWKGEPVDGIGEWIMLRKRIPRAEYETLAKQFDPVRFDAAAWVDLAVQAGMRYLVITAKHHDGFALYQSPCCPYNIVDATPFGRDPLAELADACRAAGITLGFYYSQDQDWHDPGGSRNDWDFAAEDKDFAAYLERKVKPQLRELLTQYGPVGLIWFDTPYSISREHSIELRDFVHRLQPDCLVSGRIGNDVGDYGSLGDNQIPAGRVQADYETPATLNDTWGFKSTDHHWKSTETLLLLLIDLASKGVNYLLNVGPTAAGVIPEPSAQRLRAIGAWMRTNEDSTLEVLSNGMTAGWMDTGGELSWQVKVFEPGSFEVTVIAVPVYGTTEVSEHHLQVAGGGSAAGGPLRGAAALNTPRSQYFPEYAVTLGRIALDAPGTHHFTLRATRVVAGTPDGVTVFGATLRPV